MLADGHREVHYKCIDFKFDGKEKAEKIEWTEKHIDKEIAKYSQCHLKSQAITPAEVERVQIVVGGDHGDVAFQFGASVTVEIIDKQKIEFEVSVCEVICRKDTGKLIEATILPKLTEGLKIVTLIPLCIGVNPDDGELICEFDCSPTVHSTSQPKVEVFVTGDLAFQAMALGKESMAGHWCMQCTSPKAKFPDNGMLWTMEDMVRLGAKLKNGEMQQGINNSHVGLLYLSITTWSHFSTVKSESGINY